MAESRTYSGNGHTAKIVDPENITRNECLELALCGSTEWNKWRDKYPTRRVLSLGEVWDNTVDFSDAKLGSRYRFSQFNFGENATFERAEFSEAAVFRSASFGKNSSFEFCVFHRIAIYTDASFEGNVGFSCSKFLSGADFRNVKFGFSAIFNGSIFERVVLFDFCSFPKSKISFSEVDFRGRPIRFSGDVASGNLATLVNADFSGARFFGTAEFLNIRFVGSTKFCRSSPAFTQSIDSDTGPVEGFQWESQERAVYFSEPPWLFNSTFEQDVSFDEARFPPATGFEKSARAYRVLKQAFSTQQATREEQRFFKLEMEEEAASENGWKRWLYKAYKFTSDFGFSVWRPLVTLVLIPALVGMFLYLLCMSFQHPKLWASGLAQDSQLTSAWLQFSFANMAPLPDGELLKDLREDLFGSDTYAAVIALKLETLQKVLALAGYFLFGLALRNLFKMK